jgi:hypothetical protein
MSNNEHDKFRENWETINEGLRGWKDKFGKPLMTIHKLTRANDAIISAAAEQQAALRADKLNITVGDLRPEDAGPEAQVWNILVEQWESSLNTLHECMEYHFEDGPRVYLTENNDKLRAKLIELRDLFHAAKHWKLCANEKCSSTVPAKFPPYRYHKCECKACNYRRRQQEMFRKQGQGVQKRLEEPTYKFCSLKCASAQRSREYRKRRTKKGTIPI